MYAAFIGFLLTFVIGYGISFILKLLKKQGKELIYTDESKTTVHPELFLPPIAHYIRKRNVKFLEKAKTEMQEKY